MELLNDDDDLVWSLTGYGTSGMMKKPMEPMMKTPIPLQRSWYPILALYMVRWHDDNEVMEPCEYLDAHCLHLMWLRHPHTYWLDDGPFTDKLQPHDGTLHMAYRQFGQLQARCNNFGQPRELR